MPCKWINLPGGGVAHINMGRSRPKHCKFCTHGKGTLLCDFPVGAGKTCDAPMCTRCATKIAFDIDYCPNHKDQKPTQEALPL